LSKAKLTTAGAACFKKSLQIYNNPRVNDLDKLFGLEVGSFVSRQLSSIRKIQRYSYKRYLDTYLFARKGAEASYGTCELCASISMPLTVPPFLMTPNTHTHL